MFETKKLSPRAERKLADHAAVIVEALARMRRATAAEVLLIGKELVAAQNKLGNRGNGTFCRWCTQKLRISRATAYNMVRAYNVFGDCAIFVQTFDVSAIYELSKNGVPKQAIERALEIGKQGLPVTHEWAKRLVGSVGEEMCDLPPSDETAAPKIARAVNPRPTALDRLKNAWIDATSLERNQFYKWIREGQVKTEMSAKEGRRLLVAV